MTPHVEWKIFDPSWKQIFAMAAVSCLGWAIYLGVLGLLLFLAVKIVKAALG